MIFRRWQKILAPLLISVLLLVSACGGSSEPTRWDQAQKESSQRRPQQGQQVSGGSFNKFFPQSGSGFQRVYTQEKQGFAQAKLEKDGKTLAMLSVSDISGNPSAGQKFQNASQTIGGHPAVQQGKNATVVLVNNRYQVKVQSRDPSFGASDRQTWLQKFDLNGIARLR